VTVDEEVGLGHSEVRKVAVHREVVKRAVKGGWTQRMCEMIV
jgi:hypothetical protein